MLRQIAKDFYFNQSGKNKMTIIAQKLIKNLEVNSSEPQ